VPYQWIDIELASTDPEVRRLIESLGRRRKLYSDSFPDGERLAEPPFPAVANKLGLHTKAQTNFL